MSPTSTSSKYPNQTPISSTEVTDFQVHTSTSPMVREVNVSVVLDDPQKPQTDITSPTEITQTLISLIRVNNQLVTTSPTPKEEVNTDEVF